ncbi:bcl-2/adenovirus E1B 19 kDa-interacting protein 2-like protein isoform X2 [Dunckerocampus dactyliophorus]|uniref:bcl-2/adenovirus E1B 19 kDa-interacting protein 2-like protein isoform X2 n=1 Tax=Dunckerocampus dactyliophorus TaxID=161453 RepID=UPI002406787D|nr:bcl-2/adenovirus E1B 19 kDa-interacting protein 2-like protein isoform X2 [Dunckerocampus dactyliophorus]
MTSSTWSCDKMMTTFLGTQQHKPLPGDGGRPHDETVGPPGVSQSGGIVGRAKKRLIAPTLSLTLSHGDSHEQSHDSFSAAAVSSTQSLDINLEAMETPSDSEAEAGPDGAHDLEWEDDFSWMRRESVGGVAWNQVEPSGTGLMELDKVDSRGRRWRKFCTSGQEYHVNMSVLEPYLQVLSHGGYYGDGMNAIILFTSCYLPENTIDDYNYVMEHLFKYMVGTLDLMVSENYLLVFLCAMAPRNKFPSIRWLRQCYTSIDRRLKKDLKGLLVVHPSWYVKVLLTVVKPFISDKFSRKIRFIRSLDQLSHIIPMDRLMIPEAIFQFDRQLNS